MSPCVCCGILATYHCFAGLEHQVRIVPPQLNLLLRRCDPRLRFFEKRLDHFDDLRDALMILVALFSGVQDTLEQQFISRKTWDRSVHEVFHIEAVCVRMACALLWITVSIHT